MSNKTDSLSVARAYHQAWTSKDFDTASELLAPTLEVEVPINEYPTAESFAAALRGFGSLATSVDLLAETAGDDGAILLYDMEVTGLGQLRVAEHFTVEDGKIVRLRQIHDTAALRDAGFANSPEYRAVVHYDAPIERVFAAAATPSGPNGWWTTEGENVGAGGDLMRLDWSEGDYILFRLDRVERPNEMRWRCIDQRDRNLDPTDEWIGTTLSWRFFDEGERTRLEFVHEGLVPELQCYEACEGGWEFFLRRSLRQLVAVGQGVPFEVAA